MGKVSVESLPLEKLWEKNVDKEYREIMSRSCRLLPCIGQSSLQLVIIILVQLAVNLGDLDLLPDPRFVQLLLQKLVLEVPILLASLKLVLEVNPLQSFVLQVALGILQLLGQAGNLGPEKEEGKHFLPLFLSRKITKSMW